MMYHLVAGRLLLNLYEKQQRSGFLCIPWYSASFAHSAALLAYRSAL